MINSNLTLTSQKSTQTQLTTDVILNYNKFFFNLRYRWVNSHVARAHARTKTVHLLSTSDIRIKTLCIRESLEKG